MTNKTSNDKRLLFLIKKENKTKSNLDVYEMHNCNCMLVQPTARSSNKHLKHLTDSTFQFPLPIPHHISSNKQ